LDIYPNFEEFERLGRIKHPLILKDGVGSVETQFKKKNGSLVDIFLSSAARRDRDITSGVVFTALDITNQKLVEREIKESQQMLQTVLDSLIHIRIFWKNTELVYLGCNRAYANDLKLSSPESIVGKNDYEFFPKSLVEKYHADDKHVMQTQHGLLNYVEPQINSDGEISWFRFSKFPLFDTEGILIGILGAFEDITAIHEADQKMTQIQDQLLQTQKMESIGRLAGGIAHEFNNILTAIMGYADLLQLDYPDPDTFIGQAAAIIAQNSQRGSTLTKQLLGFARAGKYNPLPLDINLEITKVTEMTTQLIPKSIALSLQLYSNPLIVELDRNQFELAITNLILNARDAIPDGGEIAISTSLISPTSDNWDVVRKMFNESNQNVNFLDHIDQSTSQQFIQVQISDTGVGMPESVKKHIYEPFFTTKDKGKGTGLGLPMVFGVVTSHNGIITVDSTPGQGTTFTIFLPLSQLEAVPQPQSEKLKSFSGEGTILVVDDERNIRLTLQHQLSQLGFTSLLAQDGKEAIEIYREQKDQIAAIILDVVMPVMDGPACFHFLREENPAVNVVLMSGYAPTDQIKEMISLGVSGFLQKPFSRSDLITVLNSIASIRTPKSK
ncbi:MAG: PAS domain-containing sensor histidine kinase, partial [Promethearchaeota archaeon]